MICFFVYLYNNFFSCAHTNNSTTGQMQLLAFIFKEIRSDPATVVGAEVSDNNRLKRLKLKPVQLLGCRCHILGWHPKYTTQRHTLCGIWCVCNTCSVSPIISGIHLRGLYEWTQTLVFFLSRPDYFLHAWTHHERTILRMLAAGVNELTQDITLDWFSWSCLGFMCERGLSD